MCGLSESLFLILGKFEHDYTTVRVVRLIVAYILQDR